MLDVGQQRGFERCVNHLVYAQRAKHRVRPHSCDYITSATNNARLGPTQELVTAVSDHIHTRPQAVENSRLVPNPHRVEIKQRPTAEIFGQRYATPLRKS